MGAAFANQTLRLGRRVTTVLALGLMSGPVRADHGSFSVLGWVKQKLSPEEEARSAARSSRLRPLASDPAANLQTVAMMSPSGPPPLAAPPADGPASGRATLEASPPVPGRPDSGDTAALGSQLPPPPVSQSPQPQLPPPPRTEARSGSAFTGERSVEELRRRAEYLATRGLKYKFGGDHPSEGGMDCSGTMQFLLKSMGYPDIPRTSYDQYEWLGRQGTLKKVGFWHGHDKAVRSLRPGDLVFWGGTYDSGHKVSHVMVYLGQSRDGTLYVFGARGQKVRGLNGSGVDIFAYKPGERERLVGYGRLPGLKG